MQKVILFVLVALLAVCYVSAKQRKVPCHKFCLARNLDDGDSDDKFEKCVAGCKRSKIGRDDTAEILRKLKKVKKFVRKGVQDKEATPLDPRVIGNKTDEEEAMSDSDVPASLVTTASVNARATPCTSGRIVTTVGAGATVKYAGKSQAGCGYTWYYVTGSFGSAWMASNFLKQGSTVSPRPTPKPVSKPTPSKPVASRPAPTPAPRPAAGCRTRNYPLFKQCDGKWGSNTLGVSGQICPIGCLMSSVSMALNGLGRSVGGQASNPGTLNAYLRSHGGYSGNLFIWGAVAPFGLRYQGQPTSIATIKNYICQNAVVLLNVNGGGHWVLATGHDGANTFYVNDPGFSRSTYPASAVVRAGVYTL